MSSKLNDLKSLANCGSPWAEQRAQIALSIADQYARGDLDESEYNELLEDLIRTDELDDEADDMAVKMALVGAVKGLMLLA